MRKYILVYFVNDQLEIVKFLQNLNINFELVPTVRNCCNHYKLYYPLNRLPTFGLTQIGNLKVSFCSLSKYPDGHIYISDLKK